MPQRQGDAKDGHSELEPQVFELAQEILTYMKEHPDAADTCEGIKHWWLLSQRIERGLAMTQLALDYLEKEGIVATSTRGEHTVYRLAAVPPRGTE